MDQINGISEGKILDRINKIHKIEKQEGKGRNERNFWEDILTGGT